MPIPFKLEIEYEEGEDEVVKIKINDEEVTDHTAVEPRNGKIDGKPIIDVIMITEGSRCVWRNGRLYCSS